MRLSNLKYLVFALPALFIACGNPMSDKDPRNNGNDGPIDGKWVVSASTVKCTGTTPRSNYDKVAFYIDNNKGSLLVTYTNTQAGQPQPLKVKYPVTFTYSGSNVTINASGSEQHIYGNYSEPAPGIFPIQLSFTKDGERLQINNASDFLCPNNVKTQNLPSQATFENQPAFSFEF